MNVPVSKESGPRPSLANPVKEFGRQLVGSAPMSQPIGVKLECAAGSITFHPERGLFRLVRKEKVVLELPFPKNGRNGPWSEKHDEGSNSTIWSVSVLVGQLDIGVHPDLQPFSVISEKPTVIKGAIQYALNCYRQQLVEAPPDSDLYARTERKIELIKATCLTNPDVDNSSPVSRYAFRIPHTYGLVSELAMQLSLNYASYAEPIPSAFWVNATEFRPGTTQIAKHQTGPDFIIHAHQIAVSAEIQY